MVTITSTTKKLCLILIAALLVVILCMCSGCFIRVGAPEYDLGVAPENPTAAIPDIMAKPQPTTPITVPTEPTPTEPAPTEPIPTEPAPTEPAPTEPPATKPTEPVQTKTKYYDVPLSNDLQDYIFQLCERYDIDPALIIAMIKQESNYNPNCVGDGGDSLGLMQIQAKWHQKRMDRLGCPNLKDPYQNVTVGIDFLVELYGRGKPTQWVLMAYNGGEAYANRNWNNGVTSSYAKSVLNIRDNLKFKD